MQDKDKSRTAERAGQQSKNTAKQNEAKQNEAKQEMRESEYAQI